MGATTSSYRLLSQQCERGKASAPLFLGGLITAQLTKGLVQGQPKLEQIIAANPDKYR
ncbi:hypothetical protein [Hyphomonas polymorpha]|uniref:hypothetical protein n=1 Tax=Hyphomonas polymorpha TaxID=74319 RepID=UPI0018F02FE0|nr:hypothetical protein [Hyphomonas polymorpha]